MGKSDIFIGENLPIPRLYTCNTCAIAYCNSDLWRDHMRSDWHRYNLQRRVNSLPLICADAFNEKALQASIAAAANEDIKVRFCEPCSKHFNSENSYLNHLSSRMHKKARRSSTRIVHHDEASSTIRSVLSLGQNTFARKSNFSRVICPDVRTDVISPIVTQHSDIRSPAATKVAGAWDSSAYYNSVKIAIPGSTQISQSPIDQTASSCLICNIRSPCPSTNVVHMQRFHALYIPERQYLVDLKGLIRHLQRQIVCYRQCLGCGKVKTTVQAVKSHMRDKGHCKIPYSTEQEQIEIGEFYDFRSTYAEDDDDQLDSDDQFAADMVTARTFGALQIRSGKVAMSGRLSENDDVWETESCISVRII